MAKIRVMENTAVLVSGIRQKDYEYLNKYCPDALSLYDGEGKEKVEYFKLAMGTTPSATEYGVIFNGATRDDAKFLTATFTIPEDVEDVREYVADELGDALIQLNQIEAEIPAVLQAVVEKRRELAEFIEIL